jgi:hypothetical protein
MRDFVILTIGFICVFCILSLSCEKPTVNGIPVSDGGFIWNRANASMGDIPIPPINAMQYRTEGESNYPPDDSPANFFPFEQIHGVVFCQNCHAAGQGFGDYQVYCTQCHTTDCSGHNYNHYCEVCHHYSPW